MNPRLEEAVDEDSWSGARMTVLEIAAAAFSIAALSLHALSAALAARRCRPPRAPAEAPANSETVTILRPICGSDPFDAATLGSTFKLAYPRLEIVFCAADARDPVVDVARRLIAAHPEANARLLIGDDRPTANPKLNNLVKGWRATKAPWVILADSNVLMPPDYVERLLATWRDDTGLVCAPPAGMLPLTVWAEMECAFLNAYQARWQYAADSLGFGFAQGKSMLWRREDIEALGGLTVLGAELAEDAAATKVVRASGRRVRLADAPFGQPLGRRTFAEMWRRQVRWARLRRATFPLCFAAEIMTGVLPPLAAGVLAFGWEAALPIVAGWYAVEAALSHAARWPLSWSSLAAWLARDLALPVLWTQGWTGDGFDWRGNAMCVGKPAGLVEPMEERA